MHIQIKQLKKRKGKKGREEEGKRQQKKKRKKKRQAIWQLSSQNITHTLLHSCSTCASSSSSLIAAFLWLNNDLSTPPTAAHICQSLLSSTLALNTTTLSLTFLSSSPRFRSTEPPKVANHCPCTYHYSGSLPTFMNQHCLCQWHKSLIQILDFHVNY